MNVRALRPGPSAQGSSVGTLRVAGTALPVPIWMGIINVTPDSFSDGGVALSPQQAVARAQQLVAEGAAILDIGAESTRPGAASVDEAEECRRLLPALDALCAAQLGVPLSVDTRRPTVAAQAVRRGVRILNDVSAHSDPAMLRLVLATPDATLVLMHGYDHHIAEKGPLGAPGGYAAVFASLTDRGEQAQKAGLLPAQIWLDPGFGFGKETSENDEILYALHELTGGPFPVMVGPSRKRFVQRLAAGNSLRQLDDATAQVCAVALMKGASVFRVHRPAAMRTAV